MFADFKRELQQPHPLVAAPGGYQQLIAAKLPEISRIDPSLTLEELQQGWTASNTAK